MIFTTNIIDDVKYMIDKMRVIQDLPKDKKILKAYDMGVETCLSAVTLLMRSLSTSGNMYVIGYSNEEIDLEELLEMYFRKRSHDE